MSCFPTMGLDEHALLFQSVLHSIFLEQDITLTGIDSFLRVYYFAPLLLFSHFQSFLQFCLFVCFGIFLLCFFLSRLLNPYFPINRLCTV